MRSNMGADARRGRSAKRLRSGSASVALALPLVLVALFTLPAAARAAGSVYVTAGNQILQYDIDPLTGALSPKAAPSIGAGVLPTAIAVTPDGRSAYVTDVEGNDVLEYDIDPLTGALSPKVPATAPAGTEPAHVAVAPDGKSAYVANVSDDTVSQYSIDPATGALSPKTPATVATGSAPFGAVVTPDGRSAYVANLSDNTVSQYSIDPVTGVLSPKTPATVATGAGPAGIAVTPDGKSAYVSDHDDDQHPVSQYDVNPLTGALSPKTPASISDTCGDAGRITVNPDGKSAYLAGCGVLELSIDPVTGALTPSTASPPTGSSPLELALAPDGKSAYLANNGATCVPPPPSPPQSCTFFLSQYDIDPLTELLTPKTPATVMVSTNPQGIAVGPLPAAAKHATTVSVRCAPGTFAPGDVTGCTATVTDTASSGQTRPSGMVSFTSSGPGRFLGSPCRLSGSGGSARCEVLFSSLVRGGQGIVATYGGDASHGASSGGTIVLVAVPASTSGCVVFGHGRITAADGDRATFRALVAASPPRGAELYRDKGPADAMRVVSTHVDAVTCRSDAMQASVFGRAKVNGGGSFEYRIELQLRAWESGNDTYRIRLSNGYDSGAQPIRHGDLDIRESGHDHR